jgi:hypothetical protein
MRYKTIAYVSTLALAIAAGAAQAADSTPTANPAPTAVERAGSAVGNKIDEAVGPNNPITTDELATAVPLSTVNDPARALSTAQIKNPAGEAIGTVSSVDVTAKGDAKAIHADVGGFLGVGAHVVALKADKLVYLKSRNLLVTKMSKEQIKALPQEMAAN